jgi:hypothetical protein
LKRSLEKVKAKRSDAHYTEQDWRVLVEGLAT